MRTIWGVTGGQRLVSVLQELEVLGQELTTCNNELEYCQAKAHRAEAQLAGGGANRL